MANNTPGWGTITAGALAAVAAGMAVTAFHVQPTSPEIVRHVLPLRDLPPEWEGARVVHLSDLHYGNFRSEWLFEWTVTTTNALQPDLIVITGDYIRRRSGEGIAAAERLSHLRAPRGVVGILGDHDITLATLQPRDGLTEALSEAGIHLLRNDAVTLNGLRIAGTDPTTHTMKLANLSRALSPLGGELPHLLLAHSPDLLPQAAAAGVPQMLSGHTHGGQVVVPGYGPPITHTAVGPEHASGWSRMGATRQYTSRGLASHFSLRFCCRPELTVFTLRGVHS